NSQLVILATENDNHVYLINTNNFTNQNSLDIRNDFIETFEKEINNTPVLPSQTGNPKKIPNVADFSDDSEDLLESPPTDGAKKSKDFSEDSLVSPPSKVKNMELSEDSSEDEESFDSPPSKVKNTE